MIHVSNVHQTVSYVITDSHQPVHTRFDSRVINHHTTETRFKRLVRVGVSYIRDNYQLTILIIAPIYRYKYNCCMNWIMPVGNVRESHMHSLIVQSELWCYSPGKTVKFRHLCPAELEQECWQSETKTAGGAKVANAWAILVNEQ